MSADTGDLTLIRAAARDELAMTSSGYEWGSQPVDTDTEAAITILLKDGQLVEANPGMDYTPLVPTDKGWKALA